MKPIRIRSLAFAAWLFVAAESAVAAVTPAAECVINFRRLSESAVSGVGVLFDTVFTRVGSTTRQFKIYNQHKKKLNISKKFHRFYPHGLIASQILGYTDSDDNGISGLEKDYNEYLSGTAGKSIKSKGWKGKFQNRSDLPYTAPLNGNSIELTLDLNYQSILQQELEKRLKETSSKSAMGVIMNPQTGAILAMASVPSFNNNDFSKYPLDNHRCRVITDQFEPGSTFKIVAATAALSENKINLSV